jgi:hypothetical protein
MWEVAVHLVLETIVAIVTPRIEYICQWFGDERLPESIVRGTLKKPFRPKSTPLEPGKVA